MSLHHITALIDFGYKGFHIAKVGSREKAQTAAIDACNGHTQVSHLLACAQKSAVATYAYSQIGMRHGLILHIGYRERCSHIYRQFAEIRAVEHHLVPTLSQNFYQSHHSSKRIGLAPFSVEKYFHYPFFIFFIGNIP